jgi:hypothetical protein
MPVFARRRSTAAIRDDRFVSEVFISPGLKLVVARWVSSGARK